MRSGIFAALLLAACVHPETPAKDADGRDMPVYMVPGWTRPTLADPYCIGRELARRDLERSANGAAVKFAIDPDGGTSVYSILNSVPKETQGPLIEALHACRWIPARDSSGYIRRVWYILDLQRGVPN